MISGNRGLVQDQNEYFQKRETHPCDNFFSEDEKEEERERKI